MAVRFKSNLQQARRTVRAAARGAVGAVADDVLRAANRRIARDTGDSARSLRKDQLGDTRARVGATPEQARLIEHVRDGRDRWLGPALEAAEARAPEVAARGAIEAVRRSRWK